MDGLTRHSITKLSHAHFVTNGNAEKILLQLGESSQSIFKIGSPEVDIMISGSLPQLQDVKDHYQIPFDDYAILIYHPVTTDIEALPAKIKAVCDAVTLSHFNYIVIAPNNDLGADKIRAAYQAFENTSNIKLFPSIRFEYFLTLLKNSRFIIGNSSSGVREAPVYGIPTIDIGTRQEKRNNGPSIMNTPEDTPAILEEIEKLKKRTIRFQPKSNFGSGNSAHRFIQILKDQQFWNLPIQKEFNSRQLLGAVSPAAFPQTAPGTGTL